MVNEDPLSDFDPSGLVWDFGARPVRPRRVSFRCKPSAAKLHRCGGVFALAEGVGNDKGPERPAVFVHFTHDPDGRQIAVQQGHWQDGGGSTMLGAWHEGEWCTIDVTLDWLQGFARFTISHDGIAEESSTTQVPFKGAQGEGCRFLLLYNQTCDFEASWSDICVM